MKPQRRASFSVFEWIRNCIVAAIAISASAGTSQAIDFQLEVKAGSVTVSPGQTGAGLNVVVKNNGVSAVDLGGFAFQVTVASTKITFTDITTATTPNYIFAGQSTFGPNIGISNNDQDWSASDIFATGGSGISLAPGETLGLGYLIFDVAADASGTYDIVIEPFPGTSLSDFGGDDVPIASIVNGLVTVAVPEPSSVLLGGCGMICLVAARKMRVRRQARIPAESEV